MNSLAPIAVTTYIRLPHLKQTIEALQKNSLSKESDIFIFSDGPKPGHEKQVEEVREYLKGVNGFKSVSIVERKENLWVKNGRKGIRYLLDRFGKIIFLEEDIVSAPDFLSFINHALDFYEDDKRIISISGYSPPIDIYGSYTKDIYLSYRFSAWGYGIWKDRYDIVDFKHDGIEEFFANRAEIKRFCRGGNDMLPMLKREAAGSIDAFDVKVFYTQCKKNMFTIYPSVSKTKNIGHDGTGVHCGVSNKFDVCFGEIKDVFSFEKDIQIDEKIMKANYRFRRIPIMSRIKDFLKKYINVRQLIEKI